MNKFDELEALVSVIESGSFSAAADRSGVAKSLISRRISALEQRLGIKLLNRTTRSLSLTDAGREFHQRAQQILLDLHDAEQQVSLETQQLIGRIRLAAPMSFGKRHLSPALATFLQQHPAISIDLDLNDREVSLVEEGFDMALRVGDLGDSSMIAKRICAIGFVTAASPDYLAHYGTPQHPDELKNHKGLQYSNAPLRQGWRFASSEGTIIEAKPKISLRANNGDALAEAASQGLGITYGPRFILHDYCVSGRLIPILEPYTKLNTSLQVLFPPGRLIPGRVRALAEHLATTWGSQPPWENNRD